jgi:hypothetical protein
LERPSNLKKAPGIGGRLPKIPFYDAEQGGDGGLVRGDRIEIAHLVITTNRHSNGTG